MLVGLVGVEALALEVVGVELGVEPDAAALLAQIEQIAPFGVQAVQRFP